MPRYNGLKKKYFAIEGTAVNDPNSVPSNELLLTDPSEHDWAAFNDYLLSIKDTDEVGSLYRTLKLMPFLCVTLKGVPVKMVYQDLTATEGSLRELLEDETARQRLITSFQQSFSASDINRISAVLEKCFPELMGVPPKGEGGSREPENG